MSSNKAAYLKSIQSVRERSSIVFDKALKNELKTFDVDLKRIDPTVDYLIKLMKRDYGDDFASIPPHGRWQHCECGGIPRVAGLVGRFRSGVDDKEVARRLLDLFTVSVLLDAGAGKKWRYIEVASGQDFCRSEGLAIGTLHMYIGGMFSSDPKQPFQVNGEKLKALTVEEVKYGLQVSEDNPLEGAEGRAQLLRKLGCALVEHEKYFGPDARPGGLVDYLERKSKGGVVQLPVLWDALMDALVPIWPEGRVKIDGVPLGDAWYCSSMPQDGEEWEKIVPFHKLTQWLCYSLIAPIKKYGGLKFEGEELQTGLPEYRNGGLLVDMGILTLKPEYKEKGMKSPISGLPTFPVDSDVIVEWRAVTIGFLDMLLDKINEKLGADLKLPQLLEAGSWKAGRELAKEHRPDTMDPPIQIISDGTVF
ncbi:hypothetical protein TRVA0_037S00650 [Trichomonascus vanleenenianus]|uniref:URC4/urg3 family protein n=1 Tax=Trichomonascus vanleenenianus TaxID=2268995 RepID=UPI003ECA6B09